VLVLPNYVNDLLKWHVKTYPPVDGRLFSTRAGTPVTSDSYYGAFKTACRRAGVTRKLSPHKLRHHAISAMARAGVPVKVAQDAVGHTSPVMTLGVYTHTNQQDLEDLADSVDNVIANVPNQRPPLSPPFQAASVV
jgi:integrase/recombinase XerD